MKTRKKIIYPKSIVARFPFFFVFLIPNAVYVHSSEKKIENTGKQK
jgi:hypothetical protein